MPGYRSATFFGACVAVLATALAFGAPVVTPEDAGYDAKITKEKELLAKAVLPAQIIRAHLEAASERLREMDVLARKKKLDYIPQLVVAYNEHMKACEKNLKLPAEMRKMDGQSWRDLVEMVFPHTTTLTSITEDVGDDQKKMVQDALTLAGEVKELTMDAWKSAPRNDSTTIPLNVHIDVKTTSIGVDRDDWTGVNWAYKNKNVEAGSTGNILARNGIRVSVGGTRLTVGLGTGTGTSTTDSTTKQFIVVMSGKTAMINIGTTHVESAPILLFEPGTGNAWVSQVHRLVNAGAYLEVRPTVIPGGLVKVDLTPVLSYYDEGKKLMKLTKLSTTVIVPSGQSIEIGGLNTDDNTIGKAFFSVTRKRSAVSKVITLTPRIEKPMIFMPKDND